MSDSKPKSRGGRPRKQDTPLRAYWRKIQSDKKKRDEKK